MFVINHCVCLIALACRVVYALAFLMHIKLENTSNTKRGNSLEIPVYWAAETAFLRRTPICESFVAPPWTILCSQMDASGICLTV